MPSFGLPENERRGIKLGWAAYSCLTDPARPVPTSDCPGGFSRVSTFSGLETPIPAAITGPENLVVVPNIGGVDVIAWNGLAETVPFGTNIIHSNPAGTDNLVSPTQSVEDNPWVC